MELSKRKGKAVYVAKGKETVAHQVVKFLREKNVGIVICDERELNQVINWTGLRGIALCQAVLAWFMIYEANMSIGTPTTATSRLYSVILHRQHCFRLFAICCLSFDSNQRRDFGRQPNAKNKKDKKAHKVTSSRAEHDAVLEARKTSTRQLGSINRAPGLSFQSDGKSSNIAMDLEFEER